MSLRKIQTFEKTVNDVAHKVVIYRDLEWDEFQCRLYEDGKLLDGATYFTNDKADAIGTARAMFMVASLDDHPVMN